MLNIRSVIVLSLLFSLKLTFSQAQENQILYASSEINQSGKMAPRIVSIADRTISNFLTIKYEDGSKKRIPVKNVWGYVADKKLYRRYKQDFLEVVSQGDLIRYKRRSIPDHDVTTNSTNMVERPHLFSKTLDGKLYSSEKAALKGD